MQHTVGKMTTAVAVALCSAAAGAATLQDLIDNNGTIVVGNKTFSDFGYSTACGPPAGSINVTGFTWGPFLEGIQIVGPLITAPGGVCDVGIQYKVTATGPELIKDIGASFVLSATGNGGTVAIGESVWDAGFGTGNLIGQSTVSIGDFVDPPGEPIQGDVLNWHLTYGPRSVIWVQKDIGLVATDATSTVGATTINQQFSQIPEPEHTALAVLGACALGGLIIRRRRS